MTLGREVTTKWVDVGGVDEVYASLGGMVENRLRRRLVALEAKGHRSKTELRHLKTAAEVRLARDGFRHVEADDSIGLARSVPKECSGRRLLDQPRRTSGY